MKLEDYGRKDPHRVLQPREEFYVNHNECERNEQSRCGKESPTWRDSKVANFRKTSAPVAIMRGNQIQDSVEPISGVPDDERKVYQ